jgi:predicted RNA-binding Zn-ribbon protein involved in translation (DUF1610 family)
MEGDTKYGRVPADVPDYLSATVDHIRGIADSLPTSAPSAWRANAYRIILAGVLRDHADNGAALLADQDLHDPSRVSFDCGKCGKPLILDMAPGQVRQIVFKCPRCGSFNDTR